MNGPDTLCGEVFDRPAKGDADMPVELWLREALTRAYDDVLSETLPEDWLSIIAHAVAPDGSTRTP
jgi:hypothetical protein